MSFMIGCVWIDAYRRAFRYPKLGCHVSVSFWRTSKTTALEFQLLYLDASIGCYIPARINQMIGRRVAIKKVFGAYRG